MEQKVTKVIADNSSTSMELDELTSLLKPLSTNNANNIYFIARNSCHCGIY